MKCFDEAWNKPYAPPYSQAWRDSRPRPSSAAGTQGAQLLHHKACLLGLLACLPACACLSACLLPLSKLIALLSKEPGLSRVPSTRARNHDTAWTKMCSMLQQRKLCAVQALCACFRASHPGSLESSLKDLPLPTTTCRKRQPPSSNATSGTCLPAWRTLPLHRLKLVMSYVQSSNHICAITCEPVAANHFEWLHHAPPSGVRRHMIKVPGITLAQCASQIAFLLQEQDSC